MLDHDVDGRVGADRVVPEIRIAVDRPRDLRPQPIVELRDGQHLDIVADFADAVHVGDPVHDVVALVGHGDVAGEGDDALFDRRVHVVENREVRVTIDAGGDVVEDLQILAIVGTGQRDARRKDDADTEQRDSLEHRALLGS